MRVGQAIVQGVSKQYKQRAASMAAWRAFMRVDYSMFEGFRVKGVTKTVLSRGRVIIDNGKFTGRAGSGEFLRRKTYSGKRS
jgi:hypothetical protein